MKTFTTSLVSSSRSQVQSSNSQANSQRTGIKGQSESHGLKKFLVTLLRSLGSVAA